MGPSWREVRGFAREVLDTGKAPFKKRGGKSGNKHNPTYRHVLTIQKVLQLPVDDPKRAYLDKVFNGAWTSTALLNGALLQALCPLQLGSWGLR